MADHHLLPIARSLGLASGRSWWSWDRLLDECVVAYWQRRPNFRPMCGSQPGYRAHEFRGEKPCGPCKEAHATVKAIARRRRQRGLPPFRGAAPPKPLRPCGTHAAFVRHKSRGEVPCQACREAEDRYQAARPRPSKLSVLTGYTLTTEVSGPGERKDQPA